MISMVNLIVFSLYILTNHQFTGGWEQQTGHSTPMYEDHNENQTDVSPTFIKSKYNANAAIQAYIAAGVPRSQIVMGLSLYGRGWQGEFHFSFINSFTKYLFLFYPQELLAELSTDILNPPQILHHRAHGNLEYTIMMILKRIIYQHIHVIGMMNQKYLFFSIQTKAFGLLMMIFNRIQSKIIISYKKN